MIVTGRSRCTHADDSPAGKAIATAAHGSRNHVTIRSDGSFIFWNPLDALTPEVRERARQVIPLGGPVGFLMGKEPEYGV